MKLSTAYETLSDPEKRRFYDQTGFADKDAQQEASAILPIFPFSCGSTLPAPKQRWLRNASSLFSSSPQKCVEDMHHLLCSTAPL